MVSRTRVAAHAFMAMQALVVVVGTGLVDTVWGAAGAGAWVSWMVALSFAVAGPLAWIIAPWLVPACRRRPAAGYAGGDALSGGLQTAS